MTQKRPHASEARPLAHQAYGVAESPCSLHHHGEACYSAPCLDAVVECLPETIPRRTEGDQYSGACLDRPPRPPRSMRNL
jgi:hypothetical protein